jgi:hypothetical protein
VNETDLAERFRAAVADVPAHTTIDVGRAIAAGGRRARRRRAGALALSMLLVPAILVGAFVVVRGANRPAGNGMAPASASPSGTGGTATSFVGHTYVSVAWASAGQSPFAEPYHVWITFDTYSLASGPGCSVAGSYRVESDRLVTSHLAIPACTEGNGPPGDWLASILAAGPMWRLEGDVLTLTGGSDGPDMVTMVDERVAPMSALVDTMSWRLDTVIRNGVSSPLTQPGVPTPDLDIGGDGLVEVRFQCADLVAQGVLGDTSLTIPRTGVPDTTNCPANVSQLLSRLSDLLTGSFAITMHDNRLTLTTASGSGVSGINVGPRGI